MMAGTIDEAGWRLGNELDGEAALVCDYGK
jgi:hypothetical protein